MHSLKTHLLILSCLLASAGAIPAADLAPLMPRIEDQTQMWWADGFPSVVADAPWRRVVQTGRYALALHTETLRIEHMGAVTGLDEDWRTLPPADLALSITVDGKSYRCTSGGTWKRFSGPRIIESGPFLQRADVTDLAFQSDDGSRLNTEARFETAAWPDQLSLVLAARPGKQPIPAGDACFGKVHGGFGLDGTNRLEIPADKADTEGDFTLEFWVFAPINFKAGARMPWLVCKNAHELMDGNYGILLQENGVPEARINLGGGPSNAVRVQGNPRNGLRLDQWNHVAISYDGNALRLHVNGRSAAEVIPGKKRVPKPGPLAIGGRQDNAGDGYRFRGAVDEVRLYDHALTPEELQLRFHHPETAHPQLKPVREWTFRSEGAAAVRQLRDQWHSAALELRITSPRGQRVARWELPQEAAWEGDQWQQTALMLDPRSFDTVPAQSPLVVSASEMPTGIARQVTFDPSIGWHRINLDGIEPTPPPGGAQPGNDAVERVRLQLVNPTDQEQVARLMFEKTARGIQQRTGFPITGISAVLCDADGRPTGIPVQLSKNWHSDPNGGVYDGQWFHGITQVRLPAGADVPLLLTIAYGHWGGVAAASHAQLSLIGWGGNQLWHESALGSWGESICYEPDQPNGHSLVTDVRPVMVFPTENSTERWGWTSNVGGADFLAFIDSAGQRRLPAGMRTTHQRTGPCLTEVTYDGRIDQTGVERSVTASLARRDDLVCAIYRLRMRATRAVEFSRLALFQCAADQYATTRPRKMAVGDDAGLGREWEAQWGGDTYRGRPLQMTGRLPWASLHESDGFSPSEPAIVRANTGFVVREWKAQLGGKPAHPWFAEHGIELRGGRMGSTMDIVPPPDVHRLEPGDFVEATIEHVVVPQFARHYYGPNEALRTALARDENTWRMIHREAVGNDHRVEVQIGRLQRAWPATTIATVDGRAALTLAGGLGYVPVTFTGLRSPERGTLFVDGRPLNQSVHGNDFWQTDFDCASRTWSRTFTIPLEDAKVHELRIDQQP